MRPWAPRQRKCRGSCRLGAATTREVTLRPRDAAAQTADGEAPSRALCPPTAGPSGPRRPRRLLWTGLWAARYQTNRCASDLPAGNEVQPGQHKGPHRAGASRHPAQPKPALGGHQAPLIPHDHVRGKALGRHQVHLHNTHACTHTPTHPHARAREPLPVSPTQGSRGHTITTTAQRRQVRLA